MSAQLLERRPDDFVIGIQEVDVVPFCHFKPAVPSVALLVILREMEHPYPAVPRRIFIEDLRAAVRRAVINGDHLKIPKSLPQHAVQAGA